MTNRTGKPHVRVYTEERDRPVIVMVDQRLLVDTQEQTGSTMVSCDGVHPSDHGYVYHHMDLKRIVLRI